MRFPNFWWTLAFTVTLAGASTAASAQAPAFRRGGVEFNASRPVVVPAGSKDTIIVTQFFHHGQITADGRNVVVSTQQQKLVPCRVLQLGPGDFCRLAFLPAAGQTNYEIFYGGPAPETAAVPAWNTRDGLLLETRKYKDCNVNSLESVRETFQSAAPLGADFVENVNHAGDPFSLTPAPFLSRYSGNLHIGAAGTYGFLTSSRDCSFLLIDDKLVVDAPGVHGPMYNAQRGSRKDVQLPAGVHKFEYYHAATTPEAIMVAAWEPSPKDIKPAPAAIPVEVFRSNTVGRVPAGPVTTREVKLVPDFLLTIGGDVPLPDNDQPMIGVQFIDNSPKALTLQSKLVWDFGDGQTSELPNPSHVYLRPGLYTVKVTVRRSGKPFEMANRVYIDRPRLTAKDKLHKLDDYLPLLETYDPAKLDAASLRQLVLAFLFKADQYLPPDPPQEPAVPDPEKPPEASVAETAEKRAEREANRLKYLRAALNAGKAAFVGESSASGEDDLVALARLVAPLARDSLGDSQLAGQIWNGASKRVAKPELKGECELRAADVAINDLANARAGKMFLEAATARLGKGRTGPLASYSQRVWGDYYALAGDGKAARAAYQEAESILGSTRTSAERTAWQGAHSRSVEQFLKTGELDRAILQIRQWEEEFPAEKLDGYLTLCTARYWSARQKPDVVCALADQLLIVNAYSPYIEELLVLSAINDVRRSQLDRAAATLKSIVKDYPGSPLIPQVKEMLAKLEAGQPLEPKKPARSP